MSDLRSPYTSTTQVPYGPAGTVPGAANPTYHQLLITVPVDQSTAVQNLFQNNMNFMKGTFVSSSMSGDADITYGALNYSYTDPARGVIGGWGGLPATAFAGDVWLTNDGRLSANLAWSIAHETGHVLGLKDMGGLGAIYDNVQFTVMSYNPVFDLGLPTEYQLHDIAALQHLYGISTANSSKTVYDAMYFAGVSSNRQTCIWDYSGSRDTIKLDGLTKGAFVDLRPGHFSTVGSNSDANINGGRIVSEGRHNVSIAFGAFIEDVIGTSANDGIIGNGFNNILKGEDGDDVIFGDGGPPNSGATKDADYTKVIKGGTTAVDVDMTAQADELSGGAGNDVLWGGLGSNTLNGGADNDTIHAGQGTNVIIGGSGDDVVFAGRAADNMDGGDGKDTVSFKDAITGVLIVAGVPNSGGDSALNFEMFEGSSFGDTITGSNVAETVLGMGGADILDGGDGADSIEGGKGSDKIKAGLGDTIFGGSGNDTITVDAQGPGKVVVVGGLGDDVLKVVESPDPIEFRFAKGDGNDRLEPADPTVTGGLPIDRFVFEGISHDEVEVIWNPVKVFEGGHSEAQDLWVGHVVLQIGADSVDIWNVGDWAYDWEQPEIGGYWSPLVFTDGEYLLHELVQG